MVVLAKEMGRCDDELLSGHQQWAVLWRQAVKNCPRASFSRGHRGTAIGEK